MKGLVCHEYGDFRGLRLEDMAPPPLTEGLLLDVTAAGLGYATLLAIEGRHQNRSTPPFIPGIESVGMVRDVAGPSRLERGDRAVALVPEGGLASELIVPAATAFKVPDALSDEDALLAGGTYAGIHMALAGNARLQAGETLLVHGAGGVSGLSAVIIGKALGARVIASTTGDLRKQAALDAGADEVLDRRSTDIRTNVNDLTGGRGANVIFDPVGGDTFDQSLRCIAPDGRIVVYGFASGRPAQAPTNILLVKSATIIGFYWGYYLGWAKQQPEEEARQRAVVHTETVLAMMAAGQLAPIPIRRFWFERHVEAMEAVESGRAVGKVVLLPRGP